LKNPSYVREDDSEKDKLRAVRQANYQLSSAALVAILMDDASNATSAKWEPITWSLARLAQTTGSLPLLWPQP